MSVKKEVNKKAVKFIFLEDLFIRCIFAANSTTNLFYLFKYRNEKDSTDFS